MPRATLILLGAALFGPAIGNELTTWDDNLYVTENPLIRDLSWSGVWSIFTTFSHCNYHPLTYFTYMVEHALVGLSPWLYHATNVALHLATTLVAFELVRRWASDARVAFIAAFLFLAHPLRVESVAWVAERKDVLCGLFYLLSMLLFTRSLDEGGRRLYWGSLGVFLLALLSKAMAITLPFALGLVLVLRRRVTRRAIVDLAPFAILAVIFAVVGVLAQAHDGGVKALHGGRALLHALTPLKALWFYAGKLLLPLRLSPRYAVPPATGLLDPAVLGGAALLAALATAAVVSYRGRRVAFLGILFFLGAWSPVSGIVPTSTLVADRYLYLPALGLFFALAHAVVEGVGSPSLVRRAPARACVAVLTVWGLAFCVWTPRQALAWKDGETLFESALRENPSNPFAYNQLAVAYVYRGDYTRALAASIQAVNHGMCQPEFLYNLCVANRGLGNDAAERANARAIAEAYPEYWAAWSVEARFLALEGKAAEARALLARLRERDPESGELVQAQGDLALREGDEAAAFELYGEALRLRPGHPETILGICLVYARTGETAKALLYAGNLLEVWIGCLEPSSVSRFIELVRALDSSGDEEARRGGALLRQTLLGNCPAAAQQPGW